MAELRLAIGVVIRELPNAPAVYETTILCSQDLPLRVQEDLGRKLRALVEEVFMAPDIIVVWGDS